MILQEDKIYQVNGKAIRECSDFAQLARAVRAHFCMLCVHILMKEGRSFAYELPFWHQLVLVMCVEIMLAMLWVGAQGKGRARSDRQPRRSDRSSFRFKDVHRVMCVQFNV